LAINETNSYHIVNSNGIYLVACKLVITPDQHFDKKEIENLHSNALRALRILYSIERHKPLLKRLFPMHIFEQFVDIGNFKRDLKPYKVLLDEFYKISVSLEL
jgi:hypothetical protein